MDTALNFTHPRIPVADRSFRACPTAGCFLTMPRPTVACFLAAPLVRSSSFSSNFKVFVVRSFSSSSPVPAAPLIL
ncbi:hypothetical protein ACOSP7_016687 [Xanthoceras sorbifolium]